MNTARYKIIILNYTAASIHAIAHVQFHRSRGLTREDLSTTQVTAHASANDVMWTGSKRPSIGRSRNAVQIRLAATIGHSFQTIQ